MSEKYRLKEEQIIRRVIYVGDRIAFGMSFSFIIIMLLVLIFNSVNITFLSEPIVFGLLLIFGLVLFVVYLITTLNTFFKHF